MHPTLYRLSEKARIFNLKAIRELWSKNHTNQVDVRTPIFCKNFFNGKTAEARCYCYLFCSTLSSHAAWRLSSSRPSLRSSTIFEGMFS